MSLEDRILVASHIKRDGELAAKLLRKAGMVCEPCSDCPDLCDKIEEGACCIVVAREFLEQDKFGGVVSCLDKQPAWSHLPIIILASSGELQDANDRAISLVEPLKNDTILERPVRVRTLLSVVKAAIADRRRQYQTRELLLQL